MTEHGRCTGDMAIRVYSTVAQRIKTGFLLMGRLYIHTQQVPLITRVH